MNAVVKMTIYKLFFTIGGRFQLEIKIPETYPFNPPKVILFLNALVILVVAVHI